MRNLVTAARFTVLVCICLLFQKQSYSAARTAKPSGSAQVGSSNDVMRVGAKCDVTTVSDARMQAGSNILTSQRSSFGSADVGKVVAVMGAGAEWDGKGPYQIAYATLFSTIQRVIDRHSIQLADSALTTVTEAQASWATDDSTAIQTAFDHLGPNGQLTFSRLCGVGHAGWQGLSINTSNVTLSGKGAGSGLVVFYTPATAGHGPLGSALRSVKTSGLSIRNLEINGNGITHSLLGLRDVSNSTFAENHLHNTGSSLANGIQSFGGSGNTYTSNTVSHCGRGMWIGNPNPGDLETNATITHNSVTDNLHSGIAGTMQNSLIDSNTVLRNGGSCIPLGSTPEGVYQRVTISHNTCEYNAWDGIQSDTSPGSSGIPASDAIRMMSGAPHDITITDNIIDHNGNSGIYAVHAVNWTIRNNRIYGNGYIQAIPKYEPDKVAFFASGTSSRLSGIAISRAADIKVLNNEIHDDPGAPTQNHGIFVDAGNVPGSIKGITLEGNTIDKHRQHGINLVGHGGTGEAIVIANNKLLNNRGYGIVINRGYAGVRVESNTARGNAMGDYRNDVAGNGRQNRIDRSERRWIFR